MRFPSPPRAEAALLALLFAVALAAPLAVQMTHPAPTADAAEQRALAKFPKVPGKWKRPASWEKFCLNFESYYNDHFGLRVPLLQANAWLRTRVFRSSPSPSVLLGREGWLFFNGEDLAQDYRGLHRLSAAQLANWKAVLEARQAWLARRGIKYLFVFVPDKQSIYPEFMPARIQPVRSGTALDQLTAYLRAHCAVPVLDLRAPLRAAKGRDQLYWKNDTHWTAIGAFAGYAAIMDQLHRMDPALTKEPAVGLPPLREGKLPGDLRRMIYGNPEEREGQPKFENGRRTQGTPIPAYPDGTKPQDGQLFAVDLPDALTPQRAVIYRDSFFVALQPLFSAHFRRSVYFWRTRTDSPEQEKNLAALVEQEQPQVFVEEMVERFIDSPPRAEIVFGGAGAKVALPGKNP